MKIRLYGMRSDRNSFYRKCHYDCGVDCNVNTNYLNLIVYKMSSQKNSGLRIWSVAATKSYVGIERMKQRRLYAIWHEYDDEF
ncbi:hypothetical protein G3O08_15325 [Cryomorpha ignava]|uniref:Uncharacterized protein n=1 Tax=Cryomorpha ignava TaxID=101383 RepID=A0A7K3WT54_9FLAO|nr:hypothetical protein [Cryomorpha ignava]NEN24873.1 hypothetical protein [Cryomorpha ignava]